ncbi:MAG: hypothetical protein SFW35_13075 [Chitinophagales bacterium]|nr:hypothetical protein [Chitinophagales bacterium]
MRPLFFTLLIGILATTVYGQSPVFKEIRGNIYNVSDSTPLANINVINIRNRIGSMSNSNGLFSVYVFLGDTIKFSATNFETRFLVVDEKIYNYGKPLIIYLRQANYQLPSVSINPLPKNLKDAILNLQLPPDPIALNLPKDPFQAPVPLDPPNRAPQTGGVQPAGTTFTFGSDPYAASIRRQKTIIAEWEENQKKQELVALKFNPKVVKRVTGISDEMLEAFMRYCKLSDTYVLYATDYEIGLTIKARYHAFMAQN